MHNEYPPEYDFDDTLCAQCGSELPEIPVDAGPHLGPLWEGFCSDKCLETNAREEKSREDALFSMVSE